MSKKNAGRQAGQIIPRGENVYLIRVYTGQVDGKKQYVSKTVHGTISQAMKERTKMLRESDTKTIVKRSAETVNEWLKVWLDSKQKLQPQTLANYKSTLKTYVEDTPLGRMRLSAVERSHMQSFYNAMAEKGYGERMITYVHMIVNQAFGLAVVDSKIQKNPCDYTERGGAAPTEKPKVMTPAEVNTLLEANADQPLYAMWALLLMTGMRPQEVLPLRWSDISGSTLTVNRVVAVIGGKQEIQEGRAKTEGSLRQVSLPEVVLKALKAQRIAVAKKQLEYGDKWIGTDLVFPGRQGRCKDLQAVRRNWSAALTRAKLEDRRLYDTRHTHITQMIEAGVPAAVVAARVGNSAAITLKVYTNVLDETQAKLGSVADAILSKKAVGE
jgi:integrase